MACAIQNLWLAARAENIGMGWVSLFDPEALRGLFGADTNRLAALLQNFADSAARDVAAIRVAAEARQLAASAHRLHGAARMAGARMLAERAMRAETAAKGGDLAEARRAADGSGAAASRAP